MQQADVVFRFLLPPHQNAAVAVQPGVNPLDDPATGSMAAAELCLFFAARADVGRVTAATGVEPNGFGIVGFVGARCCLRRPAGRGRRTGMLVSVASTRRRSCTLAPATAKPMGMPRPSVSIDRFTPSLPRSVGFFRFFSPPSGALVLPRPDSANAKRCRAARRSDSIDCATVGERRLPPSSLESNDGQCCRNQSRWGPLSIGTRCGGHSRCRSSPAAGLLAAALRVGGARYLGNNGWM